MSASSLQPELFDRIVRDFEGDDRPSAALFSGPEFSGRFWTATEIASRLSRGQKGSLLFWPSRNIRVRLDAAKSLYDEKKTSGSLRCLAGACEAAFASLAATGGGVASDVSAPAVSALDDLRSENGDPESLAKKAGAVCDYLRPFKYAEATAMDDVRGMAGFFSTYLPAGGVKTIVIENLEKANANVNNALLKILEEPPADSLIILISSMPDRLMKTILSRVRRYEFRKPSPETVSSALGCECSGDFSEFMLERGVPGIGKLRKAASVCAHAIEAGAFRKADRDAVTAAFAQDAMRDLGQKERASHFFVFFSEALESAFLEGRIARRRAAGFQRKIDEASRSVLELNVSALSAIEEMLSLL